MLFVSRGRRLHEQATLKGDLVHSHSHIFRRILSQLRTFLEKDFIITMLSQYQGTFFLECSPNIGKLLLCISNPTVLFSLENINKHRVNMGYLKET